MLNKDTPLPCPTFHESWLTLHLSSHFWGTVDDLALLKLFQSRELEFLFLGFVLLPPTQYPRERSSHGLTDKGRDGGSHGLNSSRPLTS